MCSCDYDAPAVYDRKERRARTAHRCSECARPIRTGETYEDVRGLWDGRWDRFRTCSRCLDLRRFAEDRAECSCWAHGNVIEDAIETAREEGRPGLLFGAYRRLVAIRRNPPEA